ncbi:MAG: hypothetical protein C0173_07440 [Desulfurella sp.]|nr:MAG: hypothetical protein C0173_07440 [Desulfurella sp.]
MGIARLDKVLANLFSLRAEEFEKSGKPDRSLASRAPQALQRAPRRASSHCLPYLSPHLAPAPTKQKAVWEGL